MYKEDLVITLIYKNIQRANSTKYQKLCFWKMKFEGLSYNANLQEHTTCEFHKISEAVFLEDEVRVILL